MLRLTLRTAAAARLALGLGQGIVLYLLYRSVEANAWPATNGLVFAPLVLVVLFVPLLCAFAVGNLRIRTLVMWMAAATVLLAGLSLHDVLRDPTTVGWWPLIGPVGTSHTLPRFLLVFFTFVALFIAHSLIVAGDLERRYVARYATYFDVAWKHAVQLAFAFAFVAAFWGVLLLGAGLFKLIEIEILWELIQRDWFRIPATTLAFCVAIEVTDVSAAIVRGIRTLALTLLSWLLPLLVLFVVGFLASLPFTGLEALWGTGQGTLIVLIAQAVLIVLINAAYQDGGGESSPIRFLRYAAAVACAVLAPLAAISIYGLGLRVQQYGWTEDRIAAAAGIVVAVCYAVGYGWALFARALRLERLEVTNIATAFVTLAVLFALFTPIADPARISVSSQVARLKSGQVNPQEFDFTYLRFDAGRYGRDALEALAADGADEQVARLARQTLDTKFRQGQFAPATPETIGARISMHPPEKPLPDDFVTQDWLGILGSLPSCMRQAGARCSGFFADLNGDGAEEIVLVAAAPASEAVAFKRVDGRWIVAGRLSGPQCASALDTLRRGGGAVVAPMWRDLEVDGLRFRLDTNTATDRPACK